MMKIPGPIRFGMGLTLGGAAEVAAGFEGGGGVRGEDEGSFHREAFNVHKHTAPAQCQPVGERAGGGLDSSVDELVEHTPVVPHVLKGCGSPRRGLGKVVPGVDELFGKLAALVFGAAVGGSNAGLG